MIIDLLYEFALYLIDQHRYKEAYEVFKLILEVCKDGN